MSARYLGEAVYLADESSKMLDIRLLDSYHSALIKGENEQGQPCNYIIMPMRVENSEFERERDRTINRYVGRFSMRDINRSAIHEHVEPLEASELIEILNKNYLKRDLDAFLEKVEQPVAA